MIHPRSPGHAVGLALAEQIPAASISTFHIALDTLTADGCPTPFYRAVKQLPGVWLGTSPAAGKS